LRRDHEATDQDAEQEPLGRHLAAVFGGARGCLCAWAVALVFGSIAMQAVLSASPGLSHRLSGISTSALAGCMGLAGVLCYLARFALTGRWSHAYAAAGFWTLTCAQGLGVLVGSSGRSALESAAWIIAGALLFVSTRADGTTRQGRRNRGPGRLATIGMLSTALPLISALSIIRTRVSADAAPFAGSVSVAVSLLGVMAVAAAISVVVALIQCCRRQPETNSLGVIPYFLVVCGLSLLYRAMAACGLTEVEVTGHVLGMVSWVVLAVGFGIEAATGQAEVRDRIEELETMHQVSWSVVGTRDSYELLSVLASTLREKLDAGIVCVYLAGKDNGTLRVAAAYGPSGPCDNMGCEYPIISTSRFPGFHTGHSARAFATGEAQIVRDVFVEVELVPWRIIARDDGCAISLPLTDEEGTLGVLALYFPDHRQLTQTRIRLLTTLANAAAPAIRTANEAYMSWVSTDGDSGEEMKRAA